MKKIFSLLDRFINGLVKSTAFWLIGLLLVFAIVATKAYEAFFPQLLLPEVSGEVVMLDQGWTDAQRQAYYQTSQGTLIMPYSWFMAMELAPSLFPPKFKNENLFSAPDNQTRYRLITDKKSKYNPDNLPVGIVKNTVREEYVDILGAGYKDWISISCAACHTGQFNYKGTAIRIDGGQGMWNFSGWSEGLVFNFMTNVSVPSKFDRFSKKVLEYEEKEYSAGEIQKLKIDIKEYFESPLLKDAIDAALNHTYPTTEGGGRTAALGRGVNGEFGLLDQRNVTQNTGAVSFPPVWFTHDYDWVQSVGAIRQPMGRNVTEAWGVNVQVELDNDDYRWATTATMQDMYWMETLLSIMKAPPWPENILGKIDREKAEEGRRLYEDEVWENARNPKDAELPEDTAALIRGPNPLRPKNGLCARCHGTALEVNPNKYGKKYFQLPLYRLNVMGTDPDDAVQFNERVPYTGVLSPYFDNKEKVGVGKALKVIIENIKQRWYEEHNIGDSLQVVMDGYRENLFRAPLGYPARPMAGYWATPPFLHNGSVPNMYQLLGSKEDRSEQFALGSLEYDPINLGFLILDVDGAFIYDTNLAGNSNAGHEFKDAPPGTKGVIGPKLSHKEKMAIIEYMKIIADVKLDSVDLALRAKALYNMRDDYENKY